ncbi:hypothetical protein Taro_022220 [Colocasia esculenta]|uniref:Uncharacterized protein n=1 Tax=Colocasia esculenta TaxID=4460 RepID=A0A843V123_COLES|nr:hypothetical protein [Colocasia esculenta]
MFVNARRRHKHLALRINEIIRKYPHSNSAEHPTSAKRREITLYGIDISFIPLHAKLVSMEGFSKKS